MIFLRPIRGERTLSNKFFFFLMSFRDILMLFTFFLLIKDLIGHIEMFTKCFKG